MRATPNAAGVPSVGASLRDTKIANATTPKNEATYTGPSITHIENTHMDTAPPTASTAESRSHSMATGKSSTNL
jgi:hypothetical protein